ncbi:hypothetical protein EHS25_001892 [Saitozyma podzolica]|uniref:HNH nuclease domain-containing protein n=1 Tax=Saitozyma podzolica TaxID=1890683 RepID=A0A427YFN6_9TREE|nr:hypothetical protein EHS25_001892 [Saitozyma podzolica]
MVLCGSPVKSSAGLNLGLAQLAPSSGLPPAVRRHMSNVQYELAASSWGVGDTIDIVSVQNTLIASFPLEFVQRGGDNSWRYVLGVLEQLVDIVPGYASIIRDQSGADVDLEEAPWSGEFVFAQNGIFAEVAFSRGPEYFSRFRPPNPQGSVSTRSDSSRSSANQSRFRLFLIARDGQCLISGESFTQCTAAHIVPASRPDVYELLSGRRRGIDMFSPAAGLLLRSDLHHTFDRQEWSLYHKVGDFTARTYCILGPRGPTEFEGLIRLSIPFTTSSPF